MTEAKGFYSKEFKLKAVKLYINRKKDENLTSICNNLKISSPTLHKWVLLYRDKGEEGLIETETSQNSRVYDTLKLNSLKNELDVMQQAYNDLKNELSIMIKERDSLSSIQKELEIVTKERDTLRKAIEVFVKTVNNK